MSATALLPVAEALAACSRERRRAARGRDGSACAGRAAARWRADLAALRTQPPFDASAMDGYARARRRRRARCPPRSTSSARAPPATASPAKSARARRCASSPARRCPTAPTRSLIQENTEADGDARHGRREARRAGRNIRRAGLDFREGDVLLTPGRRLDARASWRWRRR